MHRSRCCLCPRTAQRGNGATMFNTGIPTRRSSPALVPADEGSRPQPKEIVKRRSFLKQMGLAGAAATMAPTTFLAQSEEKSGQLSRGDAAILRFLAAAEIIETDLWQQYNELGGVQDNEVPGGAGNAAYTAKLQVLDGDMPQYIH